MITWLEQHLMSCPIKLHFGVDCPGCGTQRALIALLRGNFQQSLEHHIALIPFILTIVALIAQLIFNKPNGAKWVMWLFIITSSLTFLQYIYKQLVLFGII